MCIHYWAWSLCVYLKHWQRQLISGPTTNLELSIHTVSPILNLHGQQKALWKSRQMLASTNSEYWLIYVTLISQNIQCTNNTHTHTHIALVDILQYIHEYRISLVIYVAIYSETCWSGHLKNVDNYFIHTLCYGINWCLI